MTPAAILARAFHEDPFISWAEPNPSRRLRLMTTVFGAMLKLAAEHQGSLVEPGVGAVEWTAPERAHIGAGAMLTSGMWRVALISPPSVWARLSSHEEWAMARVRPLLEPGTTYLRALGVDPAKAGRGHGGRLLEHALEEMSRQRWTKCVLRTEQPRNVAFYRKHGFSLVEQSIVPPSGLTVWIFSRPVGGGSAG